VSSINDEIDTVLAAYHAVRREQLELCDRLEEIADSLPDQVDTQRCIDLSRTVIMVLSRAQKVEEEYFFPALRISRVAEVEVALNNLQLHHTGDVCYAEELSEALLTLGEGSPVHDPEVTGYMLRGFFEGVRRHIAFEEQLAAELRSEFESGSPGNVVAFKQPPMN